MTEDEKKRLSAVLDATEYLFLENMALKLVLEHRGVTNWQKLVDHLLSDKEMLGGVRLTFRELYREDVKRPLGGSGDLSRENAETQDGPMSEMALRFIDNYCVASLLEWHLADIWALLARHASEESDDINLSTSPDHNEGNSR